ncbi:SRPBCC family protein [Streptomyces cinereoruber]|uniref:SRPBCC family protein n=1 Tax=Streptomyces cinereoruber TaxID=67260 RepID=UPI003629AF78
MPGQVDNSIVIKAPFDQVWDVTNDLQNWPSLFGEYADVEILHQGDSLVTYRTTMHPDESGKAHSWVSEREADREALTVRERCIESGQFAFMETRWEYEDLSEGVKMRWIHDFAMKPAASMDDSAMTDRINRNSKLQMALIQAEIEHQASTAG